MHIESGRTTQTYLQRKSRVLNVTANPCKLVGSHRKHLHLRQTQSVSYQVADGCEKEPKKKRHTRRRSSFLLPCTQSVQLQTCPRQQRKPQTNANNIDRRTKMCSNTSQPSSQYSQKMWHTRTRTAIHGEPKCMNVEEEVRRHTGCPEHNERRTSVPAARRCRPMNKT